MFNPITIILQLGGIQACIMAVILLYQKKNINANRTLSMLLFLIGVTCILYAFNTLEFYLAFPHLIRMAWGLPLLFGPLLFLYTKAMTNPETKTSRADVLHGLPFVVNMIILMPFYLKSAEEKIQSLDYFTASITAGTDHYAPYYYILQFVIIGIGVSYGFRSLKLLEIHQRSLLSEFSEIQSKKVQWLRQLIGMFITLFLCLIFLNIRAAFDRYANFDYQVFFYLGTAILVYVMSFKTFNQPQLHALPIDEHSNTVAVKPDVKVSLGSKGKELLELMLAEKPYLDCDLSATQLSELLSISRHQLSDIINKEVGKNFYDFINEYRVNEVKLRIVDIKNTNLTFLAIAYDSGFNSKSSFNAAFKKLTGLTPSQFKKDQEL